MLFFYIFFALIIIQRILELYIAKKNSFYIQKQGGYEVGGTHYPLIVALHIAFLISLFIESSYRAVLSEYWLFPFSLFLLAQGLRFWAMLSLGRHWNTRIYVLPQARPVKRGPYRFFRHPNYTVVMLEMITIPLTFSAYVTAVIFPMLNAILLSIRIKIEEQALSKHMKYNEEMAKTPRFLPPVKKLYRLLVNK